MRWLAFLILICLAASGCTQGSASSSDDNSHNRFGGFYGGVSGGDMGP